MEQQNQSQPSIQDLFVHQGVTDPPAQQVPASQPAGDPTSQVAVAEQPAPAPQPAPQAPHMVPLPELLEQRHARQIAEMKAQQAESRLAEYQRALEAQYRASQPQPQPIDPVAEPERFAAAVQHELARKDQQMQEMAVHQRANTSEMLARGKHGDEKVDQAVKAAVEYGVNRNFMMKPDPYRALMDWHTAQSVAQQVGPDLSAYRQKVRDEIIAEMKLGRPAPQNLPPSLSTATNAQHGSPVVQEPGDFFKSMMNRKG